MLQTLPSIDGTCIDLERAKEQQEVLVKVNHHREKLGHSAKFHIKQRHDRRISHVWTLFSASEAWTSMYLRCHLMNQALRLCTVRPFFSGYLWSHYHPKPDFSLNKTTIIPMCSPWLCSDTQRDRLNLPPWSWRWPRTPKIKEQRQTKGEGRRT